MPSVKTKMRVVYSLVGLFFGVFFIGRASAQDLSGLEQGIKPYGSYHGGDIDSISMVNGQLTLHIPLTSYTQRGGKLQMGFKITYTNPNYQPFDNCPPPPQLCTTQNQAGYRLLYGGANAISIVPDFSLGVGVELNPALPGVIVGYTITDYDGAIHHLGMTNTNSFTSTDTTGYNLNTATTVITDHSGVRHTFQIVNGYVGGLENKIQDPNGNTITANTITNPSGSVSIQSWTDTVGRTIPSPPGFTAPGIPTTDFSGCTGTQPTASAALWSPPGLNGATAQYKVCYASFPVSFFINPSNCQSLNICQPTTGTNKQIQSIVLPNGTAWTFEFDTTGALAKIGFPTGGSISYTSTLNSTCTGGGQPHLNLPAYGRSTISRSVDANDGSGPHIWNYGVGLVTDPAGNDTVHQITSLDAQNACSNIYETELDQYQGSHSGGTLLKKTITVYGHVSDPFHENSVINVVPTSVTTTDVPSGKVTQIAKTYDSGIPMTGNGAGTNAIYGDLTSQSEFDFGGGSPGPLLRATNYSYFWQSNPSYASVNILDIPCLVTVYGPGSVPSQTSCAPPGFQANQVAQTIYGYDENNGSPLGVLGNQTSVTRWLNGGTSPKSQTVFNTQGMSVQQIDQRNNTTQIIYDGTGAFPSQIKYPATSGVAHNESFNYDANTGLLNSHTDQNSQTTSYGYDSMRRFTSVAYPPGGGVSTLCYTDEGGPSCSLAAPPFKVVATKQVNASTNLVSIDVFDGLGRPIQTQLTSDPDGTTNGETSYDALGRVFTKSNPHRSAGSPTDGTTTYFYDALGRSCLVVPPDGTQPTGNPCGVQPSNDVFTAYSGNATTVTDQAGKVRTSTLDGLGRLTQVVEGSLYETDYAYDALGNLTCVAQKGTNAGSFTNCASTPATWRPRVFVYDSLSRLTSSTNPESNTIPSTGATLATTYNYDANGNLVSKIEPAQNQTGTATVTVSYCYDALNRLLSKGYTLQPCPMISPVTTYAYDQGSSTAYPIGRRTGMTDAAGSASWLYDAMGRPSIKRRTTNNIDMTTAYTYNLDGSVATLTYPSGRTITYAAGGAGRPLSAIDQDNGINYALGATYAPQGVLSSLLLGQTDSFGGINLNQGYNNRLQPASIRGWSTSGVALDLNYCFYLLSAGTCPTTPNSNDGNVTRIVNNRDTTRTQNFTYDGLNRIATAFTDGNVWGETLQIDAWGNLNQISAYAGKPQAENLVQAAGSSNRFAGMSYDAAGNLLNDGASNYSYDAENRIVAGAGVNYTYDGDGNRVQKSSGKLYWYGVDSSVLTETDVSGNLTDEYVFFGGTRIAHQHVTGNVGCPQAVVTNSFYLADHLGSSRVVTDSAGNILDDSDFYPFGRERVVASSSGNSYKFTGKERDTESGLDNFGARYDSSALGRFMSPDWSAKIEPVPYSKLDNPQSLNLYSYTLNNPLSNVDTDGHACSGVLGNSGSGFCTRATEYGKIDANPNIQSQTRFFAAANAVSQGLADVAAWGLGVRMMGVSAQTSTFLEGVGQKLQGINEAEAHMIASGSLSGPGLDQQLVHNEQTAVQGQLNSLQQSNPSAYNQTVSEINGALNPTPGSFDQKVSSAFPTDAAFQGVLNGVRNGLGRNIDFSKQGDREAIGNALINHVRQTGGCDVNGSKQGGCQ